MSTQKPSDRFSRDSAAGYDREVIGNSNIVLVGTGALGQFIAVCLALIGYPRITFIDMDVFEDSNATRSPFYENDTPKAKATAIGAAGMCTALEKRIYRYAVTPVQRLGDLVFESASAVISAVDCLMARAWLAQRCRKHRIPLVEGGFHAELINVSTLLNRSDEEPCWACGQQIVPTGRIFSCEAYASKVQEQGFVPATAPGAMALASLMAGQLTQVLHGNTELANTILAADLRRGTMRLSYRATDPACVLDHTIARNVITLDCTPRDSVRSLLGEISRHMSDPMVELPAAFVQAAPCLSCREITKVNEPEWAISGPPVCTECGGDFQRIDGAPEQHGFLFAQTGESLAALSLQQIGLGPRLLLEVNGRTCRRTFQIAGDGECLFSHVSN